VIAIRVDASHEIGTGHVKRCLALAQALAEVGADVIIVSRKLDDTAPRLLASAVFPVRWLAVPEGRAGTEESQLPVHAAWARVNWADDAAETAACLSADAPDWVVIDHYAFDARWHRFIRNALNCRIAAVDDLADRPLDCDLLIDQNWHQDHDEKYRDCFESGVQILGGPRYALLGAAYRRAPKYQYSDVVRSIGIFMGGTDAANRGETMLEACVDAAGFAGPVAVVSTSSNPNLERIKTAIERRRGVRLRLDLPDLSDFYAQHDLQLGAGGSSTWERCCIGVPSLVLAVALNQRHVIDPLEHLGVLRLVKNAGRDTAGLGKEIRALIDDTHARSRMARLARTLVDGEGAHRVASLLMEPCAA